MPAKQKTAAAMEAKIEELYAATMDALRNPPKPPLSVSHCIFSGGVGKPHAKAVEALAEAAAANARAIEQIARSLQRDSDSPFIRM